MLCALAACGSSTRQLHRTTTIERVPVALLADERPADRVDVQLVGGGVRTYLHTAVVRENDKFLFISERAEHELARDVVSAVVLTRVTEETSQGPSRAGPLLFLVTAASIATLVLVVAQ